ncbi:MAG: pyridoxamine kinase [Solobacterium sp.]|nr:pyridoxamine kinase [Solobacterium sp.]MBQ1446931.1 pyridoxamine kinase [Solobacterium sp.]
MKKVVTMQDISCAGRCSLTVALPIISAMGVECAVIPTAVLSTHTKYKHFSFKDLTDEIGTILDHWKQEDFRFDAVYVGYLGSLEQLDLAKRLFAEFGGDALKLADPAMGDNGRLYSGISEEFAGEMRRLCADADIIVPNLTEAAYLLNEPYLGNDYTEEQIKETLKKLTGLGCRMALLTGISFEQGKIGAYGYDSAADSYVGYFTNEQPEHFHGTGDIWASTFTGAIARGKTMDEALKIASDYTAEVIRVTIQEPGHNDYEGVCFEKAIPYLIDQL